MSLDQLRQRARELIDIVENSSDDFDIYEQAARTLSTEFGIGLDEAFGFLEDQITEKINHDWDDDGLIYTDYNDDEWTYLKQ